VIRVDAERRVDEGLVECDGCTAARGDARATAARTARWIIGSSARMVTDLEGGLRTEGNLGVGRPGAELARPYPICGSWPRSPILGNFVAT